MQAQCDLGQICILNKITNQTGCCNFQAAEGGQGQCSESNTEYLISFSKLSTKYIAPLDTMCGYGTVQVYVEEGYYLESCPNFVDFHSSEKQILWTGGVVSDFGCRNWNVYYNITCTMN